MRRFGVIVMLALLGMACAGSYQFGSVDDYSDIGSGRLATVTEANAADIIQQYSVDFEIPNPIYGPAEFSPGRSDPSHQSSIVCHATLLDDFSTKADILVHCPDSLGVNEAADCREAYESEQVREGNFRIRISMESGFSERSMDREYWSIYLETANGVMIEPNDYTESPITSVSDSVYSNLNQESQPRYLMRRDLTLYFNRIAFWGEDLLGRANPYLVLVISRDQRTLARVAWNFAGKESR